jgi:WD40 repeat protein
VRTSAKIEIFEGHTGNITCLAFDSKGKWLASYSATDLTIRLWKVGNASFFSTIMGGNGKETKQIKLLPVGPGTPMNVNSFKNALLAPAGGNSYMPGQEEDMVKQSKCRLRFLPENEKHIELIREDGSK